MFGKTDKPKTQKGGCKLKSLVAIPKLLPNLQKPQLREQADICKSLQKNTLNDTFLRNGLGGNEEPTKPNKAPLSPQRPNIPASLFSKKNQKRSPEGPDLKDQSKRQFPQLVMECTSSSPSITSKNSAETDVKLRNDGLPSDKETQMMALRTPASASPKIGSTRSQQIHEKSKAQALSTSATPQLSSNANPSLSNRSLRTRQPSQPCFKTKSVSSIDLTGESDSDANDVAESVVGGYLSRDDLIKATGSSSTGVDRADFKHSSHMDAPGGDSDYATAKPKTCIFLQNHWVGADKLVLEVCNANSTFEFPHTKRLSETFQSQQRMGCVQAPGIGSYVLTVENLECLEGPEWLNDEVVNAYMCALQIRSNLCAEPSIKAEVKSETSCESDGSPSCEPAESFATIPDPTEPKDTEGDAKPKCLFFNSFFYALLRNAKGGYSYENVKRWSRHQNLSAFDNIFFPINVGNTHWCLAVVRPRLKKIEYYDSLGGSNPNCLDLLERYLQDEGATRGIPELQGDWTKVRVGPPTVPRQLDGCSCGLFVCAYSDCLSAGRTPGGFTQQNMAAFRGQVLRLFVRCRM